MHGLKKIGRFLLHPPLAMVVGLTLLSVTALVCIFATNQQSHIAAPIVYAVTVYSLVLLAVSIPKASRQIRAKLYQYKLPSRYLTDIPYQLKLLLYLSLSFNLLYAVIKLSSGLYYASFWYGADALFYLVLSIARWVLLSYMRKGNCDLVGELKRYRYCAYLLLVLSVSLIGVVYQIIHNGMGYVYPDLLIYIVATYTFWCMSISTMNLIRYRKLHNPSMSAQKTIDFTKALVAMFALQSAMFSSFGSETDPAFRNLMNNVVATFVCTTIFAVAIYMLVRVHHELKLLM